MDAAYTGQQIAERRKALGMTQKALAEKLHVTDKAVSKWERGINFPDLGLMESLANVLETTPACLLGLEDADRDALVSSITEISNEQVEEAKKDIRRFGWSFLLIALILILIYCAIPRRTVRAYQLLSALVVITILVGRYTLVKYEDIRKMEPEDLLIFLGAFFPAFLYVFIQFATGYSPNPAFGTVLIGVTAVFGQLFFWRIMRPYIAKLLPAIATAGFALWHSLDGDIPFLFLLPALCTGMVAAIFLWKNRKQIQINRKRLLIVLCVILLIVFILCFLFYTELVRSYVMARHDHLESYAQSLLSKPKQDSYGLWTVRPYPDKDMVEFYTGGAGLAPNSTYEGFYYSAADVHIPHQGVDSKMEVYGDTAHWQDSSKSSDNWGTSTRILPHWFWFEAHY